MTEEAIHLSANRSWGWRAAIGIAFLTLALLIILVTKTVVPYVLNTDKNREQPSATATLQRLPPDAYDSSGRFLGLASYTAERLNALNDDRVRGVTFVAAEEPSTGPKVVSVNPIDDYTWGAAALSARSGVCYLTLLAINKDNPRLGGFKRGWLPPGSNCVGKAATPQTVRDENWPSAEEISHSKAP